MKKMFKKKKIKNIAVCSKCGEEIEWIKSDKGKMYAINIGKKEKNQDYYHSSTCIGLEPEPTKEEPSGSEEDVSESSNIAKSGELKPSEKPEEVKTEPEEEPEEKETSEETEEVKEDAKEMKEITVGDILNNHEERIKQLEIAVSKMLEHFGRIYLESDKKA